VAEAGGKAGRFGGPRAAKVGEDGLDGEGVLEAGDDAQPAATARASEDIEGEHAVHQLGPGPGARGDGSAGAGLEDATGSRAGRVTAGRRVHRGSGHARGSRHQSVWRRGSPAPEGAPSRWSGRRQGCGLLKQVRHCYAAFACTDPMNGQNNFKDPEEPPPP
jgi:hypothetical protein